MAQQSDTCPHCGRDSCRHHRSPPQEREQFALECSVHEWLMRGKRAEEELRRTRVGLALYSLWVDVNRTGLDAGDPNRRLLLHIHEVVEAWEGGATAVEVLRWLGELLCGDLPKDKLLRTAMAKVEDVVLGRYREGR